MEQSYCRGVEWKLEIERWSGDWNRTIVEGWNRGWNRGQNRGGKAIVEGWNKGVEQRVEIGTVARTVIGGATSSLKA